MVARYTLCSGHGYNKRGWDRVFLQQTQLPKLFDVQTATESCNCDPGYFSSRTFATGTASCDCGTCGIRVEHCTTTVRSYFCSCHGRDNAGPEYLNTGTGDQCGGTTIDEGCAFLGDQTPGQVPWSSQCAPVYNSVSSGTPNVLCLCDHDYIGIPNGQGGQNQCNTRISVAICNGRGQDPSSGSRYPANAIALQNNQWRITGTGGFYACQCDDGFGPNTAGSTTQCSTFLPCQAPYSCGSATGRGTCGCSGTCCTCNAGFGGIACCPLKFGTTAVCNGFATAKCQNDGTCNCPPGTQDPGCCVGCDLSQECQLDGRCSCPKIAGDLCGIYGTCVASGIPVGSQLNCTCNGTSVVDVDGPTGPIAPKNVTYGGKFCCPVINGLVCGPGGSVCTSTPHPSDPLTGGCACGPGRAGRFCCPIAPGQTKECGDNGVCQTNGQCLCRDIGVTGSACELNTNCDNVVTTQECRGSGSCVFSSPGLSAYLQDLRFDDVLNLPYTTTDGQNFTDEGAVQFLRAVSRAFHGFDPLDQPQESKYYTANITACQQALAAGQGRGGCLWAMLSSCFPPRDAFIGTFSTVEAYVERAFRQLHPTRIIPPPAASPQGTFMLQESAAYTNTCLGGGQPREAMASLLSWELWLQLYRDPNNPTSLPAASGITLLPSHQGAPYHCRCTPPLSTAQIGIDSAPGGFRCQFTCPVGGTLGTTDLQVCSGFSQGVFRGACVGNNLCECSSKFSGNACQFPLTPSCFAVNSQDAEPCTNSRHGFCRRVDVPGQTIPNFNCNCSAQFTGTYCELCRCQPPSVQPQPGECNGRGQCLALSGGLFRCDCSAYLTTLYDTGDSNRIPFLAAGNACEANGTAFCANFKQAAGQPVGIGNWQVCSQRGSCVWDYNTNTGSCSCQPGYSGNRCQLSLCIPDCNMHQNCDTGSGTCGCFPFWGTPATCTPGNRTCECSQNLCDHGTPTSDGTACICDVGWKKVVSGINAGKCSVVQCRLVVHNDQGVRPCIEPQDQRCSDLSSIAQSLQQGCCVDTCPVCVLNTTSNTRSCQCDALSGSTPCYDSQNEMCLPKCHGNDVLHPNPPNCDSSTNPITCHCEHVSLLATQFRDLRCQRYTCLNGGTRFTTTCNPALQQCCDCSQTAYSGSFCTTSICGQRGTPFPNGTSCDCIPPFDHSSPARKDCDIDRCSPGTVVADPTSMTRPFYCNCPGSTFVVSTVELLSHCFSHNPWHYLPRNSDR